MNSSTVTTMKIRVKTLLAGETNFSGDVELPLDSTIGGLISHLQVKLDEAPDRSNVQILINGIRADQITVLKEGDRVHLLSALNGG